MPPATARSCAPSIEESATHFLIRYCIQHSPYQEIVSSIAPGSVLLLGVAASGGRISELRPDCLIAVLPLAATIDPEQTSARLDGHEFTLTLKKSPGPC